MKDSKFARAAGRCWMISAVARAYNPGCKVDHVLLLEGPQGILKSTVGNILASDAFFLDDFSEYESKDALIKLHGAWIIELSELSGMKRAAVERVKAFITSVDDIFRAPYDRRAQHHPRECVFVGSTNDANPFIDETGNRRFWPVRCEKLRLTIYAANATNSGLKPWHDSKKGNTGGSSHQN